MSLKRKPSTLVRSAAKSSSSEEPSPIRTSFVRGSRVRISHVAPAASGMSRSIRQMSGESAVATRNERRRRRDRSDDLDAVSHAARLLDLRLEVVVGEGDDNPHARRRLVAEQRPDHGVLVPREMHRKIGGVGVTPDRGIQRRAGSVRERAPWKIPGPWAV